MNSPIPISQIYEELQDPLRFAKVFWPDVFFYSKQRDIIYSVEENDETVVHAGNMLGKDFVAAFIKLKFFLTRHPVRVLSTSVDASQLEGVLWGETRRFIQNSVIPLDSDHGGPIVVNHLHLRKIIKGEMCGVSYMIGRVSKKGEGMLGHHAYPDDWDGITPHTLFVGDEGSGIEDITYERRSTWAARSLIIGNPYPCENYFRKAVEEGDIVDDTRTNSYGETRYHRKVINIGAKDSPNVQYALEEIRLGLKPSNRILVPGVLAWRDYQYRLKHWDKIKKRISLAGKFYKGAETLLFPPHWLMKAEEIADNLRKTMKVRNARSLGIDSAQGGDKTSFTWGDKFGAMDQLNERTPDTNVIPGLTIEIGEANHIPPHNWIFDMGGGGKEHADRLRASGYPVRVIGFGEAAAVRMQIVSLGPDGRQETREVKYTYKNKRAEMYGLAREYMNPMYGGYGIPEELTELHRQLAKFPLMYDEEMRLYLPPKRRKDPNDRRKTLTEIIGCSPDESDSFVLMLYGLITEDEIPEAGALG